MFKNYLSFFIIVILCSCSHHKEFSSCSVTWDSKTLSISTGKVERIWSIEPFGLVTKELNNLETGKNWSNGNPASKCDWDYYDLVEKSTKGRLISINATESNDSCFTSDHLYIDVEYEYPDVDLMVKYQIRAYPDADGFYTALSLKGNPSQHITGETTHQGITFETITGDEKHDMKANATVAQHFASFTHSESATEHLISGIDANGKCIIGVSLWNPEKKENIQDIKLCSVDNETEVILSKRHRLPSPVRDEVPEELLFEVPADISSSGAIRVIMEKIEGEAKVSEIWIYQNSPVTLLSNADPVRLDCLKKSAPSTEYHLAGYINCGNTSSADESLSPGRVDYIPVDPSWMSRTYAGYYNDTQHRNKRETPLLEEETLTNAFTDEEINKWANLLLIQNGDEALWIVKESHKCVNQYGIDTGEFISDKEGISVTGTSLRPDDILPDRYRQAWGTWTILCSGNRASQELALKRFERSRYPVNHDTDVYLISNAWGSGRGANATYEDSILIEIQSKKALGIDVQQIDDGYFYPGTKRPVPEKCTYRAHPSKYPDGFQNVRREARENGISLGLWFPAMPVSLEDMIENYDEGGFKYYKLDFTDFRSYSDMEDMIRKIRAFEKHTDYTAKVNWDVTENATRFGYFWAKEYGCVFLENRRHDRPVNVIYEPYLVLRDLWHLAKYCNLNKFQGTIQNKDMVDPSMSDARKYSHGYTVAIALMSTPLFFQETHFLSEGAISEISEILKSYKNIRHSLYDCFVFPIGNEPDNASWTGFQAHHPTEHIGYLNLFREIDNSNETQTLRLNFLENKEITFVDILNGVETVSQADENGNIEFRLSRPGEFKMLKYTY